MLHLGVQDCGLCNTSGCNHETTCVAWVITNETEPPCPTVFYMAPHPITLGIGRLHTLDAAAMATLDYLLRLGQTYVQVQCMYALWKRVLLCFSSSATT